MKRFLIMMNKCLLMNIVRIKSNFGRLCFYSSIALFINVGAIPIASYFLAHPNLFLLKTLERKKKYEILVVMKQSIIYVGFHKSIWF